MTSATTAILVTSVVTFVLIPARIKRGDRQGLARMLGWRPQCMHNLNLIFVVSEMLFASLPVVASHFVFPALFGIQYVLISWWWLQRTGVAYYPFLDPTLPPAKAVGIHAVLFLVLALFFGLRVGVATAAALIPLSVRARAYAAAASICWTRRSSGLAKGRVGHGAAGVSSTKRESIRARGGPPSRAETLTGSLKVPPPRRNDECVQCAVRVLRRIARCETKQ